MLHLLNRLLHTEIIEINYLYIVIFSVCLQI